MPYVSARYAPPGPLPESPGMAKQVIAIDDQGAEWSLREDSQVGDWLRYINEGGTIDPADPVPEQTSPEMQTTEHDYAAKIAALDARLTTLENKGT